MKTVEQFRYETPIKFNVTALKYEVEDYQYDHTATPTSKNNSMSLYKKILAKANPDLFQQADTFFVDTMVGESKGNTARVYHKPSYTSYPRVIRKAIVPMDSRNKFVYLDIKAAEYVLNCIFAEDTDTLDAYANGQDPYMVYASEFPAGMERSKMKEVLISNMYGVSAFTAGKRIGCSESEAKHLLATIRRAKPKQSQLNSAITWRAQMNGAYYCPNGVNKDELMKVADIDPADGYNENRALSVYTQSALGLWMQSKIKQLQGMIQPNTTLITVFDSILFEIPKESDEEAVRAELKALVAPFRADIGFGENFYLAQNSAH